MRLLLIVLVAAVLASMAAACSHSSSPAKYEGIYVSLGDSVAAGNGASDKASTSFAALLAKDEGGLQLVNLAVAGNTTTDVIEKQLPQIDAAAASRKIAFIAISIGGYDLAALIPNATCQQDPLPASCPLDEALASVERNLDQIMRALRMQHADTPIVLLLYPNFFSGTGHVFEAPAARVLPRLDDVIARVAARYPHTAAADAAPAFDGNGRTLTRVLDPQFDPHPNDAGHRLIANAFEEALKHTR
ncbi:MAG: SGNH/GDSL hydrolase family protein [Chloroflexota bacterium]|nr:SGNH/GDSL hydrolase family protein [Chloroflexota bacterium]